LALFSQEVSIFFGFRLLLLATLVRVSIFQQSFLGEEVAEGVYSNLAMIAHSNSEFVIDFIRLMPGVPKAKVKSRIIVTPDHAKRLLSALKDNIEKYEAAFGKINQSGGAP